MLFLKDKIMKVLKMRMPLKMQPHSCKQAQTAAPDTDNNHKTIVYYSDNCKIHNSNKSCYRCQIKSVYFANPPISSSMHFLHCQLECVAICMHIYFFSLRNNNNMLRRGVCLTVDNCPIIYRHCVHCSVFCF